MYFIDFNKIIYKASTKEYQEFYKLTPVEREIYIKEKILLDEGESHLETKPCNDIEKVLSSRLCNYTYKIEDDFPVNKLVIEYRLIWQQPDDIDEEPILIFNGLYKVKKGY